MPQNPRGTVYVVDDDEGVRDSLSLLLTTVGLDTKSFESGDAFLEAYLPDWNGCVLLDVSMPGCSGIDVQRALIEQRSSLSIIFLTGQGDVPMAVDAIQHGAFDFLQKPFDDAALLDRVERALAAAANTRDDHQKLEEINERLATLTPREREVMQQVVLGSANKVIAMDLGLSQRTVEVHRSRVMEKMRVRSLAELVKISTLIES